MFLRVDLGDWNITEKYFRTINFSGLSAEGKFFALKDQD